MPQILYREKTSYAIPVPYTGSLAIPDVVLSIRHTWETLETVRTNTSDILLDRFIAHDIGPNVDRAAIRMLDPVRDLRLEHGWSLAALVEGENPPMVWKVPLECVVAINGIMYASDNPVITRCTLSVGEKPGAIPRGDYSLEPMWALNSRLALFVQPIIFEPRETMRVIVWSREDRPAGERFGLFGMIAEPLNRTVTL